MPNDIKTDLTTAAEPVEIDKGTTPIASQMIDYLDRQVGNLNIQNKAGLPHPIDPLTGQPMPITGVNLKGIDQIRKNLSTKVSDAFANSLPGKISGDARAAKAVLNAFDDRIDAAVNGGMFNGSPDAINAWNNARAAYHDYRTDFFAGKNDPAGRVVEKL